MGRTVINETENKQTVILNDSADNISGGYFDADMVWHELSEDLGMAGLIGKRYKLKNSFTGFSTYPVEIPLPAMLYDSTYPDRYYFLDGIVFTSTGSTSLRYSRIGSPDVSFYTGGQTATAEVYANGVLKEGMDKFTIELIADFTLDVYNNNLKEAYEKVLEEIV